MKRVICRLRGEERGLTLPELLVASLISAMIGALLITVFSSTLRVERYTSHDSRALGELRTGIERFQKEVRQARKVYEGSGSGMVYVWIDRDLNNQPDFEDQIIYRLHASGGQSRLIRYVRSDYESPESWLPTDPPPSNFRIVAEGLTADSAFAFNYPPPAATVVTITLVGDVDSDSGPAARTVETQVRLRNAAL